MNRTNGKIALQSKTRLANALLVLMETYSFGEITVTQIAQEAGLSRKTFYRLFDDKDAVLNCWFEKLYGECLAEIKSQRVSGYWQLVQLYFDFWESRRESLALLAKNGLLPRVFEFVYSNSAAIFELIRSADKVREHERELPYMLAYSVGGMHCMLIKWIELGMTVPSEQLVGQLRAGFMSAQI